MIDGQINYAKYSRERLLDALNNIDRRHYPVNYSNLCHELESRPNLDTMTSADVDQANVMTTGNWVNLLPSGKIIGVILTIFAILVIGAQWIIDKRESACAERCKAIGCIAYEYQGFSGSGRWASSVRGILPDACICRKADGSTRAFVGSSLW